VIVQKNCIVLANHVHVKQFFVDNLEAGHLTVFYKDRDGELELNRPPTCESTRRGGQIHVIFDLVRHARDHFHAAALANPGAAERTSGSMGQLKMVSCAPSKPTSKPRPRNKAAMLAAIVRICRLSYSPVA